MRRAVGWGTRLLADAGARSVRGVDIDELAIESACQRAGDVARFVVGDLLFVTADPAEGEALTGAGNDLVDSVPMPGSVRQSVANFIAEHHVEQAFFKRERSKSQPPARHAGGPKDDA